MKKIETAITFSINDKNEVCIFLSPDAQIQPEFTAKMLYLLNAGGLIENIATHLKTQIVAGNWTEYYQSVLSHWTELIEQEKVIKEVLKNKPAIRPLHVLPNRFSQ